MRSRARSASVTTNAVGHPVLCPQHLALCSCSCMRQLKIRPLQTAGKYAMGLSSIVYGKLWTFEGQALPANLIVRSACSGAST